MPTTNSFIDLLSSPLQLVAKEAVQLLPAGQFSARDGRPGPGKYWTLSDDAGTRLAAEMTATAAQTRFVFDVDHQTLTAAKNGQPAPAAGWATRFEWRPGQGLYALNVKWTTQAAAWIDADQYAYISPVITWDESGQVTGVLMAAITNYPALLGMEPISTALTALNALLRTPTPTEPQPKDTPAMDLLAQLIALLGLQTGTSAETVLSTIKALKAKADGAEACAASPGVAQALGLTGVPDEATALAAIAAIKGGDAEGRKLIAVLQGQLMSITDQMTTEKVDALVAQAIADRKLLPAQKDWATALGRKDLTELQGYLATAPALLPGAGGQSGGVDPAGAAGSAALNAVQANVLAAMGVSAEAYAKQYGPKAA